MGNDRDAIQEAIRMAQTPAGKHLIQMLRSSGDPNLQKLISNTSAGDQEAAKQALSAILNNPEVQKLLRQMGGNHG